MAQDEIIKIVRVRGKVSMKGYRWSVSDFGEKEDSTGLNDFILKVKKKGRKDYFITLERVGGNGYGVVNAMAGGFNVKIGEDEEIKNVDELIKLFFYNPDEKVYSKNKLKSLLYNDSFVFFYIYLRGQLQRKPGGPVLKDFITYWIDKKGFTDENADTKFFEIVQDPYDEAVVPPFPTGYFDIWNEWDGLYKKWTEENKESEGSKRPESPTQDRERGVSDETIDLTKSYIFDVSKTEVLVSADFGTFSLKGVGLVEKDFTFLEGEFSEEDSEYVEGEFQASEEELLPEADFQEGLRIAEADAGRVEEEQRRAEELAAGGGGGGGGGDDGNAYISNKSNSSYTIKGPMPVESTKANDGGKVVFGFNGVPYYTQQDVRWGTVLYGWVVSGGKKMFIEEKLPSAAIEDGKTKAAKLAAAKGDEAGEPTSFKLTIDGKEYSFKAWVHAIGGQYGWSTIHGGGCGITSLSMVINYWEKKMKTARWVSPIKTAKIACEYGFRHRIDEKGAYPPDKWVRSKNEPSGSRYSSSDGQKLLESEFSMGYKSISRSDIEKYLSKGWPVIIQIKNITGKRSSGSPYTYSSGHFMVLTGLDYITADYGVKTDPVGTLIYRVNDPGFPTGPTYFSKKDMDSASVVGYHVFYPKSKNANSPDDVRESKISLNI